MVDNYASYLKCVYLPEQRHLTGKWPSDLSGLPQFVKNEKTMSADQNLDDFILRFHADNYEGFEPVKIQKDGGNEIYTFNIRLKGRKKKFQWMATN